jgi:hypothetical protein
MNERENTWTASGEEKYPRRWKKRKKDIYVSRTCHLYDKKIEERKRNHIYVNLTITGRNTVDAKGAKYDQKLLFTAGRFWAGVRKKIAKYCISPHIFHFKESCTNTMANKSKQWIENYIQEKWSSNTVNVFLCSKSFYSWSSSEWTYKIFFR